MRGRSGCVCVEQFVHCLAYCGWHSVSSDLWASQGCKAWLAVGAGGRKQPEVAHVDCFPQVPVMRLMNVAVENSSLVLRLPGFNPDFNSGCLSTDSS